MQQHAAGVCWFHVHDLVVLMLTGFVAWWAKQCVGEQLSFAEHIWYYLLCFVFLWNARYFVLHPWYLKMKSISKEHSIQTYTLLDQNRVHLFIIEFIWIRAIIPCCLHQQNIETRSFQTKTKVARYSYYSIYCTHGS